MQVFSSEAIKNSKDPRFLKKCSNKPVLKYLLFLKVYIVKQQVVKFVIQEPFEDRTSIKMIWNSNGSTIQIPDPSNGGC